MQAKVLTVNSVWLQRTPDDRLFIVASGSVPTSGWHNGTLHPRIYIRPPEDGMWDWEFTAAPPGGIALDVISQISAQSAAFSLPSWMRGVRVHSSTNSMDAHVYEAVAPATEFVAVTAGGDYFPWFAISAATRFSDELAASLASGQHLSIGDLSGKTLRVYETGDALTKDYRTDRFNCELKPGTHSIVRTWMG